VDYKHSRRVVKLSSLDECVDSSRGVMNTVHSSPVLSSLITRQLNVCFGLVILYSSLFIHSSPCPDIIDCDSLVLIHLQLNSLFFSDER
jgi:hypothetical protein